MLLKRRQVDGAERYIIVSGKTSLRKAQLGWDLKEEQELARQKERKSPASMAKWLSIEL